MTDAFIVAVWIATESAGTNILIKFTHTWRHREDIDVAGYDLSEKIVKLREDN